MAKAIRLGQILGQDRKGDYKAVQSQLAAITANLRTTGAGIGGAMTAAQSKQMASIQRIAGRGAARATSLVAKGQAEATNRYGSGVGGVIKPLFGDASAAAKATGIGAAGLAKSGKALVKGGALALSITQAGAAEAASSAKYATATALKYRAQQDAQLVYEDKQARATLAFQQKEADRQYALQREQLGLGPEGGLGNHALKVVAGAAPKDVYAANVLLTNPVTLEEDMTLADNTVLPAGTVLGPDTNPLILSNYLSTKMGIQDSNEIRYLTETIKLMQGGADAHSAAVEAASMLFGGEKNFDPKKFNSVMLSGLRSTQTTAVLNNIEGVFGELDGQEAANTISQLKGLSFSPTAIQAVLRKAGWEVSLEEIASVKSATLGTAQSSFSAGVDEITHDRNQNYLPW